MPCPARPRAALPRPALQLSVLRVFYALLADTSLRAPAKLDQYREVLLLATRVTRGLFARLVPEHAAHVAAAAAAKEQKQGGGDGAAAAGAAAMGGGQQPGAEGQQQAEGSGGGEAAAATKEEQQEVEAKVKEVQPIPCVVVCL